MFEQAFGFDPATFDLSVKSPRGGEEIVHRTRKRSRVVNASPTFTGGQAHFRRLMRHSSSNHWAENEPDPGSRTVTPHPAGDHGRNHDTGQREREDVLQTIRRLL